MTGGNEEDSQRSLNQEPSVGPSFGALCDESQKQMLHSMLKDSMLDLDNSRNDVVP